METETKKFNRRETLAAGAVIAALSAQGARAKDDEADEVLTAAFDFADIAAENAKTDGAWFKFFENNTMFAGCYQLPARGVDTQPVHVLDELYFVTNGKARLVAGDQIYDAGPGSTFFVKAGIPHKFIEIEEDLQVLVFFSKADPKGA